MHKSRLTRYLVPLLHRASHGRDRIAWSLGVCVTVNGIIQQKLGKAERDLVALGIAVAAIIMFVATGGTVLPKVVRSLLGSGAGPDHLLVNALLLNIALIIFGWRRYRELTEEISERRKAEEVAQRLAETDPLTGCLNRRNMIDAAEQLRRAASGRAQAVAYIMVDLDNFKQVNDMYGHAVGDKLLVAVADRLRATLPPDAIVARIGGDEFAFVMTYDPQRPEHIDDVVVGLLEGSHTDLKIDSNSVDMSMSIGIATDQVGASTKGDEVDAHVLMHRADIAMYQSKKQGKCRHCWFEPSMENELRLRNELERGIRAGVEAGEFVPYYEQQIDLETGELTGFEMLARWHSPELGVVNPEIFIEIAEEIGVIAELSEQLIVQAIADAKAWDDRLTLAVNISPLQLRDPWFAQKLLKLLHEHNFPPSRFEIEITETCLHENAGLVRSHITSLRNQGVRISLDDFGTGYSSLEQLRTLPFDRLKIDRSFIAELRGDEASSTIVDAIISLGTGLNLPITAEGIEDNQILASLKTMGQLKGQGYVYGQPETADQVNERLRSSDQLRKGPLHSDISASSSESGDENPALRQAKG